MGFVRKSPSSPLLVFLSMWNGVPVILAKGRFSVPRLTSHSSDWRSREESLREAQFRAPLSPPGSEPPAERRTLLRSLPATSVEGKPDATADSEV